MYCGHGLPSFVVYAERGEGSCEADIGDQANFSWLTR